MEQTNCTSLPVTIVMKNNRHSTLLVFPRLRTCVIDRPRHSVTLYQIRFTICWHQL